MFLCQSEIAGTFQEYDLPRAESADGQGQYRHCGGKQEQEKIGGFADRQMQRSNDTISTTNL